MPKKFKILGINSSPRKKNRPAQQDSSTRVLLEHALKSISPKADVEIIDLVDFEVHPSEGCYSTDENLNHTPCTHYDDDFQKVLFDKFIKADGVIFSSPTYWLSMSSRLAALFERLTEMDPIIHDPKARLLQGKVAGAIATAHVEGSAQVCYEILTKANYLGFIIPPHAFAFHTAGQMEFVYNNKKNLRKDRLAFDNAAMVAKNVLKMCELVRGSKNRWEVFNERTHRASKNELRHKQDRHER